MPLRVTSITLLRGSVGARLHSAGNADRSLGLVMVVRTIGMALAVRGPILHGLAPDGGA